MCTLDSSGWGPGPGPGPRSGTRMGVGGSEDFPPLRTGILDLSVDFSDNESLLILSLNVDFDK